MKDVPRRARLDLSTPAELAIRDAVNRVEQMGADTLLTEAVVLLGQAREKVADYVDGSPLARFPNARSADPDSAKEGESV